MFSVIGGVCVGKRSGLVDVCNVKFGTPLASGGQSSPKLTPTLSASSHMPEKGIVTRTYFCEESSARLPRRHTCVK